MAMFEKSEKPKGPQRERKPGEAPLHRIPIYDHKGNQRGHVGHTATEATVARFLGRRGATLKQKDGRKVWVGDKPPEPPKPKFQKPQPGAGAGDGPNNANSTAAHSLEISLKAAKGSTTDKPTAPKAHARPAR